MSGHNGGSDRERELDFLLAGGTLRGPADERMKSTILGAAARTAVSRPLRGWRLTFGALAAAAVVLVCIGTLGGGVKQTDLPVPTAKGEATGVSVLLDCADARPSTCPQGARLAVAFTGFEGFAYLVGYASHAGDDEKLWYFRGAESYLLEAREGSRSRVSSRSVVLDKSQSAGLFTLHLFLSRSPVEPESFPHLRAEDILFHEDVPLTVVGAR